MRAVLLLPLLCFVLLLHLPLAAAAQQPHEKEIQRAIIQLDERSAGMTRAAPAPEVGLPLHPDPIIARELRPYERMKQARKQAEARELTLRFAPPPQLESGPDPELKPLPLPGGREAGVDPVTVPGVGG